MRAENWRNGLENRRIREKKNEGMDSKQDNEHVFAFGIERKHF